MTNLSEASSITRGQLEALRRIISNFSLFIDIANNFGTQNTFGSLSLSMLGSFSDQARTYLDETLPSEKRDAAWDRLESDLSLVDSVSLRLVIDTFIARNNDSIANDRPRQHPTVIASGMGRRRSSRN